MTYRLARLIPLLLAGTALAAPLAVPAWAKIGVTSTTNGGPVGEPPQQPKQVLTVGVDVFASERITTGPNDQAHLLFLDGSALTIGPNSDLILDKFVYDPDKGTGTLALSLGKGVLRLVGGKITKSEDATVKVGSATIGIRGGIVIIDAQNPQSVDSYFMFGDKLTVATPLGVESAMRPGSAISLKKGQAPSSPHLIGPDSLDGVLAMLEGRFAGGARVSTVTTGAINTGASGFSKVNNPNSNGGNGGTNGNNETSTITVITDNTQTPPTGTLADGRLLRQQPFTSFSTTTLAAPRDPANNALIGTADVSGSTITLGAANGASVTLPFDPGGFVAVNSGNSSSTYGPLSGTGYVTSDSSFYAYVVGEVNNNLNTLMVVGGIPTPTANFPITGFGQHTMVALGGSAPFLPENVSSAAIDNAYYSPLYSAYSANINNATASLSAQRSVFMQASLGFSGSGASQSSFFSLAVGSYYTDEKKGNAPYAGGSFQAYLRPDGTSGGEVFRGSLATVETANSDGIFGSSGQNMAFVPESINSESGTTTRTPQAALDQPITDPNGSGYYFLSAAVNGTTSSTTPNSRIGGTMQGYAAGLADTRNSLGQIGVAVLANEDPTKVTITTSPSTNRVAATFDLHDAADGPGGTTLRFGSTNGAYDQSSAYIDDKVFGATQSPGTPSSYSNGVSTNPIVANISMVSGGAVENSLFAAAGVTPCTCAYLTWGYWAADLKYTSGPRAGEHDIVPVGTWVAGTLPGINEIPTGNVSASYTGHMMGNVSNNGASYTAVGDYTQQWNFASRSGTATINNFDGASFSNVGLGTAPVNPRDFFGNGSGSAGRSISINGSFFKGGSDPVAAVGGNFRIDGLNYLAIGSFAASK